MLSLGRLSSWNLMTCPWHFCWYSCQLRHDSPMSLHCSPAILPTASALKKPNSASSSRLFCCCLSIQHSDPCRNVSRLGLACMRPKYQLPACLAYYSTLKMETICPSETSSCVQSTRHYNPEERTFHLIAFVPIASHLWVHLRSPSPWYAAGISRSGMKLLIEKYFPAVVSLCQFRTLTSI
jgi:hypothetical protein